MTNTDYRDALPLADVIRDAYREGQDSHYGGLHDVTDERDYAMARADRLEAELADLKAAV